MNLKLYGREWWVPYSFIFPAMFGLIMFEAVPFFMAIHDTLFPQNNLTGQVSFAGLKVYKDLLSDPEFWHSVMITLLFAVIINPVQAVISLALALSVQKNTKFNSVFRTLYFLPVGSSITVTAIIWGLMMNSNGGMLNGLLQTVGIHPQPFLNSSHQALFSIIIMATWNGCGYWMVFFLAGLNEIDTALYEAASIDGAGKVRTLFYITIPQMLRVLAFVFVADTVANFILFAPVYILTQGGPAGSTDVLMYYSYSHAFGMGELPIGLAGSIALLVIVMIFVAIELRMMKADGGVD